MTDTRKRNPLQIINSHLKNRSPLHSQANTSNHKNLLKSSHLRKIEYSGSADKSTKITVTTSLSEPEEGEIFSMPEKFGHVLDLMPDETELNSLLKTPDGKESRNFETQSAVRLVF